MFARLFFNFLKIFFFFYYISCLAFPARIENAMKTKNGWQDGYFAFLKYGILSIIGQIIVKPINLLHILKI